MRINTNIASLNAQSNSINTQNKQSSALEKLSSGLKINKASDDASGMAIADKLRTQASSLGQGIQNANSGSALITIADKAMSEQSNILDVVKTKLIQASTSTTSAEGREAVRKDISKLLEQMDNISEQTNYNGINLLNQKGSEFSFQVGENAAFDIGLKTEFAVNTKGLGAGDVMLNDEGSMLNFKDANNFVGIKDVAGQFTVQYDEDTAVSANAYKAIEIGLSSGGVGTVASTVSFSVKAEDVTGLSFSGAGKYILETTDAALQAALTDFAAETGSQITKINDTQFEYSGTADGLEFGGSMDISNLKVSNFTTGSTADNKLSVITDKEVSITKDSGTASVGISSAMLSTSAITSGTGSAIKQELMGKTSSSGDAISYNIIASATGVTGGGIVVEQGTLGVQVETEKVNTNSGIPVYSYSAQASVVIENAYTGSALSSGGDSIYTLNANDVSELVFTNNATATAGSTTHSITLASQNSDTVSQLDKLAENSSKLTKVGEGAYTFNMTSDTTTATVYATLDFKGMDIKDLTISGQGKAEEIALVTSGEVFVTKEDTEAKADIRLYAGATDSTTKVVDKGGQLNGASGDVLQTSTSLSGLKSLEKDGLTADVANKFMAVIDTAMTQLNSVRSDFGSTQGQLEVATRNMMTTKVNIQAAESIIRDTDFASESANFNKQNIIAQAGTYAMSQANSMQQNVMKLLQ